jgi:hypothetical protein
MSSLIGLDWWRDPEGYELTKLKEPSLLHRSLYPDDPQWPEIAIAPRSPQSEWEHYRLEGLDNGVFEEFLNTPYTVDGALEFTTKWGFLFHGGGPKSRERLLSQNRLLNLGNPYPHGVEVGEAFFWVHARFTKGVSEAINGDVASAAETLEILENGESFANCSLSLKIAPPPPGGEAIKVFLKAHDLRQFIIMEFALTMANTRAMRYCQHCSRFMTVSAGQGRRGDRIYCSAACRTAACRARKSTG